MTGSNRRHPACKAGALPAELITRGLTNISIHKNMHCVKAFFIPINTFCLEIKVDHSSTLVCGYFFLFSNIFYTDRASMFSV